MVIYRVDYLVAKGKPLGTKLPRYVVAENFDTAVKTARKYETDDVALYECAAQLSDGYIAIARGFKGLGVANEDATPIVQANKE